MAESGTLASFVRPEAAANAIRALRAKGHQDVRVAMPALFHEVMEALERPRSKLGFLTFAGALLGMAAGFALTIGTSVDWPLVTGGKPIVSLPPFLVVVFEVTVLIGSLTNLVSMVVLALRDERRKRFPRDSRFTGDLIGVFAVGGEPALAEQILRDAGAKEVSHVP